MNRMTPKEEEQDYQAQEDFETMAPAWWETYGPRLMKPAQLAALEIPNPSPNIANVQAMQSKRSRGISMAKSVLKPMVDLELAAIIDGKETTFTVRACYYGSSKRYCLMIVTQPEA